MSNCYRPDEFVSTTHRRHSPPFSFTLSIGGGGGGGGGGGEREHSRRHRADMATSLFEEVIMNSSEPIEINESDEITIDGYSGILANKTEINEWKGALPLKEYEINRDPNPEVINKKTTQEIDYVQELAFRYLRPPTPPPPGEIIIRKLPSVVTPPAPPIIIRQQPARPTTPQPLVIREAPPPIPTPVGKKVINISGKRIPPPPRKVIIERLAPLPTKPQSVLVERWLPYPQLKRKVIFKPCEQRDPVVVKPKNIIIQWEAPKVNVTKVVKNLGVIRANPLEYMNRFGRTLRDSQQLPEYIKRLETSSLGVEAASDLPASACNLPPELCGDIYALNFIDLDKEGLTEYKPFLDAYNHQQRQEQRQRSPVGSSGNTNRRRRNSSTTTTTATMTTMMTPTNRASPILDNVFKEVNVSFDGKISLDEAKRVFQKLTLLSGREFDEATITNLFKSVGVYTSYFIDFEDFKRSLKKFI